MTSRRTIKDWWSKLRSIEGHTSYLRAEEIGLAKAAPTATTVEYDLALGNRRAESVRSYLVSRGVPASRIETRSYGNDHPKYSGSDDLLNNRAYVTTLCSNPGQHVSGQITV
jgi:hypothetical protein